MQGEEGETRPCCRRKTSGRQEDKGLKEEACDPVPVMKSLGLSSRLCSLESSFRLPPCRPAKFSRAYGGKLRCRIRH